MTLVIDASVAVKWIVPEEQEAAAETLLLSEGPWFAPDLLIVEVANVMRTKVASKQIGRVQAQAGLAFVRQVIDEFVPDSVLVERALEIASDIDHAIYDCLYIACAERKLSSLVTADERLKRKLSDSAYSDRVKLLHS